MKKAILQLGLLLVITYGLAAAQTQAVSSQIRNYWMQQAIQALYDQTSPCPFQAFGAAIVNHSASDAGDLICTGVNGITQFGNPTLHGEIAAINNCTDVLTDPNGRFKLSPSEALDALKDLTLYTTAEPCPMCAAAIRWAGFKECVMGNDVPKLIEQGWTQMRLRTHDVFADSWALGTTTELIVDVLRNETDELFAWQFNPDHECPAGCKRVHGSTCLVIGAQHHYDEL